MDSSINEQTAKYLWTIANRLSTTCPSASRFYMSNLEKNLIDEPKLLKKEAKRSLLYCNHCGNLWLPGNHKIRVHAPPSANCHIKRLLKYEAEQPWRLNNRQKKKLMKFRESTSKIVYVCNICEKKTTFPGIKKVTRQENNISFTSTPVPKIKSKKGDLNAGLFIKTPNNKESHATLTVDSEDKTQLPLTSESPIVAVIKLSTKSTRINPFLTPQPTLTNNSVQKSSSNKNKKKSLMAQILSQEKETKKKKSSISSFLISL